MSLREELDRIRDRGREAMPKDILTIVDRASEDLAKSGLVVGSLKAGERVPEFSLPNATGLTIRSVDLLSHGPLVISFYRGGW